MERLPKKPLTPNLDGSNAPHDNRMAQSPVEISNLWNRIQNAERGKREKQGLLEVEKCKSFAELYEVIYSIGLIEEGSIIYTDEQLVDIIDRVRSGEVPIDHITTTFGLRDKVYELLNPVDDSPTPPRDPDHFNAAVELEIPRYANVESPVVETKPPTQPELPDPENDDTAVELPIPRYNQSTEIQETGHEVNPDTPETGPRNPITPLLPSEKELYSHIEDYKIGHERGWDDPYFQSYFNVQSFEEMWSEKAEEYERLQQKDLRFQTFIKPRNFDEWIKVVESADAFFDSEGNEIGLSSEEMLEKANDLRIGIDVDIPESLRTIVENLIVNEVKGRLSYNRAHITEYEWKIYTKHNPQSFDISGQLEKLLEKGSDTIHTRKGKIEGELIWVEIKDKLKNTGKAIFKTRHEDEYVVVPTEDILINSNQTLREYYGYGVNKSGQKERELPYPRR